MLWLEAPDFAALDTVARRPVPFALWPVGPRPLLAHWMDEAVRRNVTEVHILATDRPHLVRAALGGGGYWSRPVTVWPQRPADAPSAIESMDHLPGLPATPPPRDGIDLLRVWLALQQAWLARRSPHDVSIDALHPSGAWVGPRARLHPSARLHPPCWIGAHAEIGPQAEIGPHALVGEHCVIDEGARLCSATALPSTYVGSKVNLDHMLADGPVLLDAARGTRVELEDRFVLASLRDLDTAPGWRERIQAFGLWLAAEASTWSHRTDSGVVQAFVDGRGRPLPLRTHRRGSLLQRRRHWLRAVWEGRLRLVGVLPRTADQLAQLPPDVAAVLAAAPCGVVSLADDHGCHDADQPEEWLHALYQAGGADPETLPRLHRRVRAILGLTPP